MRIRFVSLFAVVAATAALFALAPAARAQLPITYSVGSAGPFALGSNTAAIAPFSGTATLFSGVPQDLLIGTLIFSSIPILPTSQTFSADRSLTVNAVSGMVVQDLTLTIGIPGIAAVSGGTTTTLDLGGGNLLDVTPISNSLFVFVGSDLTSISATFLLRTTPAAAVPEPGTLALLAAGLPLGAVILRRRRA